MPAEASLLKELRQPFGLLIPDREVTKRRIVEAIRGAPVVATVGDATTERFLTYEIIPDIAVVDGMERRSKRKAPFSYRATELRCSNPAGSISKESVAVIRLAVREAKPIRVLVDGEEDLLALPLFSMVPLKSAVCYGQPLEGLVIVRISSAKKRKSKTLTDKLTDNSIPS
ncbi:MAG TPA: GTP-dependent dephospho-CoA kinase family protein [Nitrososphaera sp.]|nr:GTP-dependent dephospho-CoA kinase family protein [Nitrososphaera sp.]